MIPISLLPKDISSNPVEWTPYLIAVGIGTLIGWGLDALLKSAKIKKLKKETEKLAIETAKLNTENEKLAAESRKLLVERDKLSAERIKFEAEEVKVLGDTMKEVQRTRDLHTEACSHIDDLILQLTDLTKKKVPLDQIQPVRDRFCSILCDQVINRYCNFAEWQVLTRKRRVDDVIYYIRTDVLQELERIASWVRIVNLPIYVDYYEMKPLVIEPRTMRPFLELSGHLPPEKRIDIDADLTKVVGLVVAKQ